jgi:ubiquinone/menaquinone biosynthesis C-methylase UbiE
MNIVSAWTRQIECGKQPSSADLQDHLAVVHDNNSGFTESVAWNCRDVNENNSYDLLADIVDQKCHSNLLDLACGSGVLLDLCIRRFGKKISYSGVDISHGELKLARERLAYSNVKLYHGMAQNLDFISDKSIDIILCHWALTLMDPVVPVLATIKRVLREGGVFAAIIDGVGETAPGYLEVHKIIYEHTQRKYPEYGVIELGDPRVRSTIKLKNLMAETFVNSEISIIPTLLYLNADPKKLALEAAGFFYAAYVLSVSEYSLMLNDLEKHFATNLQDGDSRFVMPVNLLKVS